MCSILLWLWHPLEGERNLPRNEKCATLKVEQLVYATVAAVFHSLVPCRKKQPCAACLFAHFLSLSLSLYLTHTCPKFVAYIAAFIARKVNGPQTGSVSTKWRLSDSFSYFPNFRFPLSCFLQIMNYSLFLSFLCSLTFHTSFPNHLSSSILMFPLVSRHPK